MAGTHSKHRTAAAALLAGTVVATSLLFLASPAQAAGCVETRATAKDLAAAGDYAETTAKMEVLGLSLRISAGAGCAWGIVAGLTRDMSADVWLDRSTDGGASWVKSAVRKTRPLNPSTYTSAYSIDGFDVVRVCGQYMRQTIALGGSQGNPQGISRPPYVSGIYCSGWVTP